MAPIVEETRQWQPVAEVAREDKRLRLRQRQVVAREEQGLQLGKVERNDVNASATHFERHPADEDEEAIG